MRERITHRNAITESWNEGMSVSAIAAWHGLSEYRVEELLELARQGYRGDSYESDSKPLKTVDKVIPHLDPDNGLGTHTEALETVDEVSTTHPLDEQAESRYASGSYRQVCRHCGEAIQRTGQRGRAPTHHEECRT